MYVAAYPVGESWQKAKQMKVVVGTQDAMGEESVTVDRDNILRGAGTTAWGTPVQRDDGSFLLAWAESRTSGMITSQGQHDAALTVQFTATGGTTPSKW